MLDTALTLCWADFRIIQLGDNDSRPSARLIKDHGGDVNAAAAEWPKVPRGAWLAYKDAPMDEDAVTDAWNKHPQANIGLLCGREINVVDADCQESVAWCHENLTYTPWKVATSRGMHFYYSADASVAVRNSAGSGLDVRGEGGYVVSPGSVHASGFVYTLEKDQGVDCDNWTDLPSISMVDLQKISSFQDGRPVDVSPQANTGDYLMDLSHFKDVDAPIVNLADGEGRNHMMTRLAGKLFGEGLSVSEVYFKVSEWNDANLPPMEHGELMKTIHSIGKAHSTKTGVSISHQPLIKTATADVASLVFTYGDLEDKPPEAPISEWGGHLIFKRARVLVSGPPKIGKSRLVLAMAVAAAYGGKFLQHDFLSAQRVLWLQAEIHKSFLPDRISPLMVALSHEEKAIIKTNLFMTGRLSLDVMDDSDLMTIEKLLEEHGIETLIMDPLINFTSAEENSNTEMQKFFKRINYLEEAFKGTIILVHHTGKPSKNGQVVIRGASAIRGWYDTGIALSGTIDSTVVEIEARNTKSPQPFSASFDSTTGFYSCTDADSVMPDESKPDVGEFFYRQAHDILAGMMQKCCPMDELLAHIETQCSLDSGDSRKVMQTLLAKSEVCAEWVGNANMVYINARHPSKPNKQLV